MTNRMKLRTPFTTGLFCLTLAACGGGGPGSQLSLQNPNFFVAKTEDGTITGSYNASGFSEVKVKSLLTNLCVDKRLALFGDQPSESGLKIFSATCRGDVKYSRNVTEFERTESGMIQIEHSYFDAAGNYQYERLETS